MATEGDWVHSNLQEDDHIHPYGSTSTNKNISVAKIRNQDDAEIQLRDFKGSNFQEPLIIQNDGHVGNDRKSAVRPTSLHSLLSSPSSDQQKAFLETSVIRHESWFRHPKVKEHWRIVLASAFLFLLGIALILTGIGVAITPSRGYHCLIFGIIGLLCIIPGGYHFIYIYCAAVGRPGYEFENLPVLR
ncbi:unnamed protein product [Candidula unifasciata]|uniref:Transmembrane protein 134 n=1 Tax=Candidula unifasciata TaxID=100452 RepID=A0A8S3YRI5_9EUPU|nr:unnamed protein product [Candidula unifasciata]